MNEKVVKMACEFYCRRLIELNPILLITPAKLVELNRQAEGLRQGMLRSESNPVWTLPVQVIADSSPTRFDIILLSDDSTT